MSISLGQSSGQQLRVVDCLDEDDELEVAIGSERWSGAMFYAYLSPDDIVDLIEHLQKVVA